MQKNVILITKMPKFLQPINNIQGGIQPKILRRKVFYLKQMNITP